jgi:hypothetical protein
MQTEQVDAAEKALAKEFSEYLASVSREVIAPISANIERHQADIEGMLKMVADARSGVEGEFSNYQEILNSVRDQIEAIVKESEFSLFRESVHSQIEAIHNELRQDISTQIDNKSANVVNLVGAGITDQYSAQFEALKKEIQDGHKLSLAQGKLINQEIGKAVADIAKFTVESQAGAVGQLQRELANVKKLMGVIVLVVATIVSVGLFLRF